MFSFAYHARDRNGAGGSGRVEAGSAREAWERLEARGYTEIELLDDEHSAVNLADENSKRRLQFTAHDEEVLRRQSTLAGRTAWLFMRNAPVWLPLLVWLLVALLRPDWVGSWDARWPAIALALFVAWFAWAMVPGTLYHLTIEAAAWGRWAESARRIDQLARWRSWFATPMPAHEIIFRRAVAWAGQGRVDEALTLLEKIQAEPAMAPGFYEARLAVVQQAARNFPAAVDAHRRALAISDTISNRIDLALTLVMRMQQSQEAATVLAEIDPARLPPMAKCFYAWVQGLVAFDAGDPQSARHHFARAVDMVGQSPLTPYRDSITLAITAYEGLALAALGDKTAARQCYEAARPLLVSRGETDLLARCEAACC